MRTAIAVALLCIAGAASAEPHFDGFIRGEARGNRLTLFEVRIVGGTPGECQPALYFVNLTTGTEGMFQLCCDYEFDETGTIYVGQWGLSGGPYVYVSAAGQVDELRIDDCEHRPWIDVQRGIWREGDEPGLFIREEIEATAVEASSWGRIKELYRE